MVKPRISIHWFRRDLRLEDNHGLFRALADHGEVLPLFIFDTEILEELEDKRDRRVDFIHRTLVDLKLAIEKQVPIVPVTFLDHWKLFGDPADLLSRGHPGFAHAVRHPYIDTRGMTEADLDGLRRRVYDAIEGPLVKYAPKDGRPPLVL